LFPCRSWHQQCPNAPPGDGKPSRVGAQQQAAARGAGSAELAGLTGAFSAAPPDAPAANLQPGPRNVDADKRVYKVDAAAAPGVPGGDGSGEGNTAVSGETAAEEGGTGAAATGAAAPDVGTLATRLTTLEQKLEQNARATQAAQSAQLTGLSESSQAQSAQLAALERNALATQDMLVQINETLKMLLAKQVDMREGRYRAPPTSP
jgi:hypothetical protein